MKFHIFAILAEAGLTLFCIFAAIVGTVSLFTTADPDLLVPTFTFYVGTVFFAYVLYKTFKGEDII